MPLALPLDPGEAMSSPPLAPVAVESMPPLTPADEPPGMQLPGAERRRRVLDHLGSRIRVMREALEALATGAIAAAGDRVEWLEGPMSGPAPGMTPKHRSS